MPNQSLPAIDGRGKYLIPGLVDSHVHLWKSRNDLLLYIANGVTQIREMVGEEKHLKWRDEIKAGSLGPDMFVASPRMGTFEPLEGFFMSWSQGFVNVKDAEEAERTVRKYREMGYDAVKAYSFLSEECYEAVSSTSSSLGMPMVGHVPWSVEISDVINSHQSEIAHLEEVMNAFNREFEGFDEQNHQQFLDYVGKRSSEVASALIENNITITTTLWLVESFVRQKFELDRVLHEIALEYENPGISEWTTRAPQGLGWLPEVNRYKLPDGLSEQELEGYRTYWETYAQACQIILDTLSHKGVTIVAGTDANLPPTVPGFSLHDELVSMTQAGMSNSEVLRSATSVPSLWLKNNAGSIEVGKKANLVILNNNPLEDIAHTRSIQTVVLGGKVLDRTMLDELLAAVRAANDQGRKVNIDQYLD